MRIKVNIRKLILWIFFILLALSFILPLLSRIMPAGMDRKATKEFFNARNIVFRDTVLKYEKGQIRFVSTGNDTLPMILFIHGSPGSWDAFKDYLSDSGLRSSHYLVAMDRPGYGGSGEVGEATLHEQANAVAIVLGIKKNNKPVTLVSHSYGGPVSIQFAMEYPEFVRQLILIAPTISPDIEENIKFKRRLQIFSNWWLWRWTLSSDLKNCAKEMQPLPDEVRKMEKDFADLKIPITEIHGTEDALAPFGNQAYVMQKFKSAKVDTVILMGEDHFIPFTMPDKIIAIIKEKMRKNSR